jgi:tetratricopeptide (TPR) repeat protein
MNSRPRSTHFLVAMLVGGVVLAGGCDTLRARSRAQDGVKLYHDGDLTAAAAKFEEAQKLDPTVPVIWLNLGFADLAVFQSNAKALGGQIAAARAITALETYLKLKPNEERAQSYLIQTFVDTGRYDDATKYFRPAVEKSPPDTQALGTLGMIAAKVGRFEDAQAWYQKRIDADSENGEARLALGVLLWDRLRNHTEIIGKERIDMANHALAVLKEARRLQPTAPNPALYTNLVYRERANTGLGDDAKNADLGMANAYFIIASNMGKSEKAADVEKNKAYAAANADKADAIVKAAATKIPSLPPVGVIAPEFLSQVLPPEKPPAKDDGAKPDGGK